MCTFRITSFIMIKLKKEYITRNQLTYMLMVVFLTIYNHKLMAQEKNTAHLKHFKISIQKTDKGISLQSLEGSAWTDLNFNFSSGNPQAINEYGLAQLNDVSTNHDTLLAHYLFTIIKTKNGIKLSGMEGVAWKELSFTLLKNGYQMIDQYGMTE